MYLSTIMDLFSRKIIDWELSRTMEEEFVIKTVEKAKTERKIKRPLIIHSDRGSHYKADAYIKATEKMKRSYSKVHYPYDNARIESFHSLIKREWLYRFQIQGYEHCRSLVFEYIETFYNTKRIHSHCGFISPKWLRRSLKTWKAGFAVMPDIWKNAGSLPGLQSPAALSAPQPDGTWNCFAISAYVLQFRLKSSLRLKTRI